MEEWFAIHNAFIRYATSLDHGDVEAVVDVLHGRCVARKPGARQVRGPRRASASSRRRRPRLLEQDVQFRHVVSNLAGGGRGRARPRALLSARLPNPRRQDAVAVARRIRLRPRQGRRAAGWFTRRVVRRWTSRSASTISETKRMATQEPFSSTATPPPDELLDPDEAGRRKVAGQWARLPAGWRRFDGGMLTGTQYVLCVVGDPVRGDDHARGRSRATCSASRCTSSMRRRACCSSGSSCSARAWRCAMARTSASSCCCRSLRPAATPRDRADRPRCAAAVFSARDGLRRHRRARAGVAPDRSPGSTFRSPGRSWRFPSASRCCSITSRCSCGSRCAAASGAAA